MFHTPVCLVSFYIFEYQMQFLHIRKKLGTKMFALNFWGETSA